jgi:hypothetical protein
MWIQSLFRNRGRLLHLGIWSQLWYIQGFVFVGMLTPPSHLIPPLVYPEVCVCPILWFVFPTALMVLITVRYLCYFIYKIMHVNLQNIAIISIILLIHMCTHVLHNFWICNLYGTHQKWYIHVITNMNKRYSL